MQNQTNEQSVNNYCQKPQSHNNINYLLKCNTLNNDIN